MVQGIPIYPQIIINLEIIKLLNRAEIFFLFKVNMNMNKQLRKVFAPFFLKIQIFCG